jgi:HPt (histidine-containing phosphotransfer) domain-containing protein
VRKREDEVEPLQSGGLAAEADRVMTEERSHQTPIDPTVLDGLHRLHREGRPDIAKTVIMLFLEGTPPVVDDLEQAAARNDAGSLCRASHILLSSGAAVGAVLLSVSVQGSGSRHSNGLGAARCHRAGSGNPTALRGSGKLA